MRGCGKAVFFLHQVPDGYAAFCISGLFEYLRFTHVMNPLPGDAAHHVFRSAHYLYSLFTSI